MKLSANEAAKRTGKSVPTITRAIKSGKISAEKTGSGGYLIDPAELFRVFPAIAKPNADTPEILESETPRSAPLKPIRYRKKSPVWRLHWLMRRLNGMSGAIRRSGWQWPCLHQPRRPESCRGKECGPGCLEGPRRLDKSLPFCYM